jgi:hypothetical protein
MEGINNWWEEIPGERFWLGITNRDHKRDVLASPCCNGRHADRRSRPLITQVRDGDVVFHYDEARQAIVAWSTSRGRPRKRPLLWSGPPHDSDFKGDQARLLLSWTIELEGQTRLDDVVPLDEIARIQWDLFPALRVFEDEVGGPLYYPFAMDGPSTTRLLAGYVFKLPAFFVECFPAMARIAGQVTWGAAGRMDANNRLAARAARPLAMPDTGTARTTMATENHGAFQSHGLATKKR